MNVTSVPLPKPSKAGGDSQSVRLHALPPLSLYVHLPWCLKKCPYCDFNSHERTPDAATQQAYLEAVIADPPGHELRRVFEQRGAASRQHPVVARRPWRGAAPPFETAARRPGHPALTPPSS